MAEPLEVVNLFLNGAKVVIAAIADHEVLAAWDHPSVLEHQQVSGLAGHLARGGVWVVADYLDAETPNRPVDFDSASEYFAHFASNASEDTHQSIRDRGAEVASVGPDELLRILGERLNALEPRLHTLDPSCPITVIGGKIMRLHDYLTTRIVEQCVHLDDLARSVGRDLWPISAEAKALTIHVGIGIARLRNGDNALVRALYRHGFVEQVLPVL